MDKIVDNLTIEEKAVYRSAAAKGAAAWMCAPCLPAHTVSDPQYRIAVRRRAHADIPGMRGRCQHRKQDGIICGVELDPTGVHAASCRWGGWWVRKHDAAARALGSWAEEQGAEVYYEQHVPSANNNVEARLDVIIHHEKTRQPALIDVTIVNAAVAEYIKAGASTTDAAAAAVAEGAKVRKYSGATIVPFAIEEHGRLGEAALRLIRTLAPVSPEARSRAMNDIYRRIGGVVQKISADAVLAAMANAV